jgi:phasin protein
MKKSSGESEDIFKLNAEKMNELCEANMDIFKSFLDVQSNYTNLWQEYMNAQMERLSTAKNMSDVMATESGLAAEYTSKFTDANQRLCEAIAEAVEKQKSCLNIPVDFEAMIPNLKDFENMLYSATKNVTTSNKKSSDKDS